VAKDQLLLKGNFGEQSRVASNLPLEDGKVAVTVQTGTPQQVGGYIRAGSEVVVYLTYTPVASNGSKGQLKTKVLLNRVQIIAIGSPSGQGSLVTVAVTPDQAARLIQAVSIGTLYLGLLTDSVDVKVDGGVNNVDDGAGAAPLFNK
jgi:pilus assembly protein CpaB